MRRRTLLNHHHHQHHHQQHWHPHHNAAAAGCTAAAAAASAPSFPASPQPRKDASNSSRSSSSSSSSSASTSASSTSSSSASARLSPHGHAAAVASDAAAADGAEPPLAAYGVVAVFAVLCYANSLPGEFVHDDVRVIVENKDVLGTTSLWQLFGHDFWGDPMSHKLSHKSYRPLTILSFRLDHTLFGRNASWFHVTNVLLHTVACALFTRACVQVAGLRRHFATLAGVLFAVHPIHTEAVTGIVGRADVLACVFFLISLLAYHGKPASPSNAALWTSIAAGGASLLAKETGVTVFAVNMAYDVYRSWPAATLRCRTCPDVRWHPQQQHQPQTPVPAAVAAYRRHLGRRLAVTAAAAAVMMAGRLAVLQGAMPQFSLQENPAACHGSLYVRALTFCYLAAFNWWLMLCPAVLSHDWNQDSIALVTSALDPRNAMTAAAFAGAALLLWRALADGATAPRPHRTGAPTRPFASPPGCTSTLVGLLLLVVTFLPASNLFVTVGFVVAERVLYMPSMGAVLLCAGGVQRAWERRPRWRCCLAAAAIALTLAGSWRTVERNRDWHSRESLLRAGLGVLPHNAKMHYNYGNHLRDVRQLTLAAAHYREALRLWPEYASVHNNLGSMLRNVDQAEQHFRLAIRYHADHVNAHYNLGRVHKTKNRTAQAIRVFERCVQLDPLCVRAYTQLIALRSGPIVGRLHREVLRLEPADPGRRAHYGLWLLEQRSVFAAMRQFEMSMQIEQTHLVTFVGVCRTLRALGQTSRLHKFVTRWQLMRRIHGSGGASRESDIYLRDWSIKYELRNRAMIYDYKSKSPTTSTTKKSTTTTQTAPTSTAAKTRQQHVRTNLSPSSQRQHQHQQLHHHHHHHHQQQHQSVRATAAPPPSPATVVRRIDNRVEDQNCNMSAESVHRTGAGSNRYQRQQQQHHIVRSAGSSSSSSACNQKRWTKSRHKYGAGGAAASAAATVAEASPHNVDALSLVANMLDKL